MKRIKWLLTVVALPIIAFVLFLAYSVISDYRPDWVEDSISIIRNGKVLDASKPLEITTFNIGYAGLDRKQDFFMDGGTMSRSSSKEQTLLNLEAVQKYMEKEKSDVYLLQEVDVKATRSYEIDQVEMMTQKFPGYNSSFAYNYKAKWVPVPWTQPMGAAESGLLTLSKADYSKSKRFRLPGKEPIPKRYFDLKRCIMENTYPMSNGKELVIINVHLSAYDKGGEIRAQQVDFLIDHIKELYEEENKYVILGGDWNHLMSEALEDKIEGEMPEWLAILPDYLAGETGFKVAYDEKVNTVRNNDQPYVKGKNFECIIDGFLVSPNLKILEVRGTDLGFENTDHQPVTIQLGF